MMCNSNVYWMSPKKMDLCGCFFHFWTFYRTTSDTDFGRYDHKKNQDRPENYDDQQP